MGNNIATSIEQAGKLLELGIDPNTASMAWVSPNTRWVSYGKACEWVLNSTPYKDHEKVKFRAYRPAWTLGDMWHIFCRPNIKLLFYRGALTCIVRNGRNYTWFLDENKTAIDLLVEAIIELKKDNVI